MFGTLLWAMCCINVWCNHAFCSLVDSLLFVVKHIVMYILHPILCDLEKQFHSWEHILSTNPLSVQCSCEHQLWAKVPNKSSTRSPKISDIHVGGEVLSLIFFRSVKFFQVVFGLTFVDLSFFISMFKPPLQISINLFPHSITSVLLSSPVCFYAFVISFLSNFSSL